MELLSISTEVDSMGCLVEGQPALSHAPDLMAQEVSPGKAGGGGECC